MNIFKRFREKFRGKEEPIEEIVATPRDPMVDSALQVAEIKERVLNEKHVTERDLELNKIHQGREAEQRNLDYLGYQRDLELQLAVEALERDRPDPGLEASYARMRDTAQEILRIRAAERPWEPEYTTEEMDKKELARYEWLNNLMIRTDNEQTELDTLDTRYQLCYGESAERSAPRPTEGLTRMFPTLQPPEPVEHLASNYTVFKGEGSLEFRNGDAIDDVLERYTTNGGTVREIAAEAGMTVYELGRVVKEADITSRSEHAKAQTEARRDYVAARVAEGATASDLQKDNTYAAFGVSKTTLRRDVKRAEAAE